MSAAVSDGRRREFATHGMAWDNVPDPQEKATYRRSQLKWHELTTDDHARMLRWYKDLIALRRNEFQLTDGRLDLVDVQFDEAAQWLVVRRGTLHTVVNLAPSARWHVPLAVEGGVGAGGVEDAEVLLAWEPDQTKVKRDGLHLPPQSVAVVRVGQSTLSS